MICSYKFATVGILLVTLTIAIVGAQTKKTGDDNDSVSRQQVHYGDDRVFIKRDVENSEAGVEGDKAALLKANKERSKTTTSTPKGDKTVSTTHKPPRKKTKKPVKSADKTKDDEGVSTTKLPRTSKPPKSRRKPTTTERSVRGRPKKTTKKPSSENEGEDDDHGESDEDKNSTTTTKPEGSEDSSNSSDLDSSERKRPNGTKGRIASDKLLQNQETLALEHMLAGVNDWMKVLKQTRGRTYNRLLAGEFFEKANRGLIKELRLEDKPANLINYYRVSRFE